MLLFMVPRMATFCQFFEKVLEKFWKKNGERDALFFKIFKIILSKHNKYVLVTDYPEEHPYIKEEEKSYILARVAKLKIKIKNFRIF